MNETAFVRLIIKLAAVVIIGYAIINMPQVMVRIYYDNHGRDIGMAIFVSLLTCVISILGGIAVYFWANKLPIIKLGAGLDKVFAFPVFERV